MEEGSDANSTQTGMSWMGFELLLASVKQYPTLPLVLEVPTELRLASVMQAVSEANK